MSLTLKRTSAEFEEPMSFAAYLMTVKTPAMSGTYPRGYLVFKHGNAVFVLHYQPPAVKTTGDEILKRMMRFKGSIVLAAPAAKD